MLKSLAQRSGRGFDARQLQPVGMALIGRTQLAQRDHVVDRAESGEGQAQVQAGSLVAGGPDDAVAAGPVGILRIMVGDSSDRAPR